MKLPAEIQADHRVVLTLDAGGTNFRLAALRSGGIPVSETVVIPSCPNTLKDCPGRCAAGSDSGGRI